MNGAVTGGRRQPRRRRRVPDGRRHGIALVATIAAISLVGLLALTSARLARARMVGARRVAAVHDAALAAARLLDSAGAVARPSQWNALTPFASTPLMHVAGREQLVLHRVGDLLYRLDAAVQRGDAVAPARHAASLLLRVALPAPDRGAPLVAGGAVTIASDFLVDAGGTGGCAPAPAPVLVVAGDSARVRWEDPTSGGTVREDPSLRAPDAFARESSGLRSSAELELEAGAWAPRVDTSVVVVARGDLVLGPGRGRGALLVEGTLTIAGPLAWQGVIVALGGVEAGGGDVALTGTLTSGGDVRLSGGVLRHDACVARDALLRAARVRPVPAWSRAPLP